MKGMIYIGSNNIGAKDQTPMLRDLTDVLSNAWPAGRDELRFDRETITEEKHGRFSPYVFGSTSIAGIEFAVSTPHYQCAVLRYFQIGSRRRMKTSGDFVSLENSKIYIERLGLYYAAIETELFLEENMIAEIVRIQDLDKVAYEIGWSERGIFPRTLRQYGKGKISDPKPRMTDLLKAYDEKRFSKNLIIKLDTSKLWKENQTG